MEDLNQIVEFRTSPELVEKLHEVLDLRRVFIKSHVGSHETLALEIFYKMISKNNFLFAGV